MGYPSFFFLSLVTFLCRVTSLSLLSSIPPSPSFSTTTYSKLYICSKNVCSKRKAPVSISAKISSHKSKFFDIKKKKTPHTHAYPPCRLNPGTQRIRELNYFFIQYKRKKKSEV